MRTNKKIRTKRYNRNNRNVNALTYNMSWATQVNKVLGSEWDFVEACQKKYKDGGIKCNENAIKKLKSLKKVHLMGIQEVNSRIENKISKVQPLLNKYKRGKIGLSTVSIMWDSNVFGNVKEQLLFNLSSNDDRPCLILLTKKGNDTFLLINFHSPYRMKGLKDSLSKEISSSNKEMIKKSFNDENIKIIVFGNFNDDKGLLNTKKPLKFKVDKKEISVKHIKTKEQLQKSLKSCCWHKAGYKYGHFEGPGDYILTNNNIKQSKIYIPKEFNKTSRLETLLSDHKPVMAELIF